MKTKSKILTCLAAFATSAAFAVPVTLVQWGADNDIVNNFYNGNLNSITASTATSINPGANSSGYYNGTLSPAGRSAIFYGSIYNAEASTSRLQIANATPDYMIFDFTGTASNHTHAGLAFWQKSDGFLDTSLTVDFDDVEFDLRAGVNAARNPQQGVYLVVRQGASDFYVSNRLGDTVGGIGTGTYTEANVSSWSSYTPTTSILTIGSAATPTLDNITAVGFLFTSIDSNLASTAFRVTEFSVTAIPEPSTFVLVGIAFLSVLGLRRRCK